MIKRLTINNIQSHKETELEFSSGINAIVGSSNNGKSAILRALYWCIYNRPLGTDALLSHWAFDKKGNQMAPMSVTIENDAGVVTRRRTKTENQYIVNNEELNVVKTDVPEQVENVLQIGETNIQRQQDAPFLLSLTSGQVAQYFNKVVRLDIIDKVLSNAESRRRKIAGEIKQSDELLAEFNAKKEKYFWLDGVEKILVKYETLDNKIKQNKEEIECLSAQIDNFNKSMNVVKKLNSIITVKKIICEFNAEKEKLQAINESRNVLLNQLSEMEACKKSVYPDFSRQKKLIQKISAIDISSVKQAKNKLIEQLDDFNAYQDSIRTARENVANLKKQLPNVCPLCGAKMKNGVCYEKN